MIVRAASGTRSARLSVYSAPLDLMRLDGWYPLIMMARSLSLRISPLEWSRVSQKISVEPAGGHHMVDQRRVLARGLHDGLLRGG